MVIDTILNDNTIPLTGAPEYVSTLGNANSRLRKINLSVDIATQDELISVYNDLSSKIQQSGTEWMAADQALSNNLKDWAKGEELSGALHTEITAETDRAETAEEAIRADLSDNYKVTVEAQVTAETGYASTYVVKQGGSQVGVKINIPKDFLVKSAELCTVTAAGEPYAEAQVGDKYIDFTVNTADSSETAQHIYLPVNDLVDVYTGGATTFAAVNVDSNRVITATISADLISAAAVAEVIGASTDASSASTVYGAKKYADEAVAAAIESLSSNIDATGDTLVSADVSEGTTTVTIGATPDLTNAVANANSALQSISASGDYINVTTKENNSQTISLRVVGLTSNVAGLAYNTDVKSYVDTLVGSPLSGVTINGTPLTVADRVASVTLGDIISSDVADFDKAGDAAALQAAVISAVTDDRFAEDAADDYADIDAIIADLVKVRRALGALKALNVELTPAV